MTRPLLIYEITRQCVNDCIYCYNVWKEEGRFASQPELSLPQIKELFDHLLDSINPSWVILTGGEPILRPDIYEVASFLSSRGINVGIATTCILLDPDAVCRLIDSGVSNFEISLISLHLPNYRQLSCC